MENITDIRQSHRCTGHGHDLKTVVVENYGRERKEEREGDSWSRRCRRLDASEPAGGCHRGRGEMSGIDQLHL